MKLEKVMIRSRRGANNWGGAPLTRVWRPAVSGTMNQTGDDDEVASTFEAGAPAKGALLFLIHEVRRMSRVPPWNPYEGDLEFKLFPCERN